MLPYPSQGRSHGHARTARLRRAARPGGAGHGPAYTFTVGNDKVVVLHNAGLSTGLMRPKSRAKILLLFFDYRGQLQYRSIAPGDRSNPRMRGFFTIN